jgi:16S rRNA (guanine527-N7)-methyltransferase
LSEVSALDASIAAFARELSRWGERMNLVGSTDPVAISRHIADSIEAAPHLPDRASVVDLGSGAGFPGVPIAIARRDLRITLVEIREKRIAFLRHVVRTLDLEVEVRRASIEEEPEVRFDVALLRAVATPDRSAQLGARWVRESGEIWIWAGPGVELPGASRIALASGGAVLRARAAEVSRGTS